jgi:hypothetical protein
MNSFSLGNSLTFTPSLTQQQIAGERDDSTVDNTAVLSNPSSKASAYCHNVSDSPYSHINNENSHECSTTTAGAGTLTSLLDQLLTFGSMDGFAIKEGSLGTVATGGSYKRGDDTCQWQVHMTDSYIPIFKEGSAY